MRLVLLLLALPLFARQFDLAIFAQEFDLTINNGRLIDPATHTDAVRSVGIANGKIASISETALSGKQTIDARGLVISPGFIDLHSHGQTPENYFLKAQDGVTTALEMEVGVYPLPPWYAAREGKAAINYGASAGYLPALMSVMHDTGTLLPRDKAVERAPTASEWHATLRRVSDAVRDGGLGIGVGIAYTPLIDRTKILDLFRLGAQQHLCLYVHIRNGGPVEPGFLDALQEVIADAAITGAPLHVVHITSMALAQTPVGLQMIAEARRHGLDVSAEAYPYTAGMTDLSSAIFAPGWQGRQGNIDYKDLQWAATGERLTEETFNKYRAQGGMVAVHSIPEPMCQLALRDPSVMVASDGILTNGKGHPRAAGTYARVLGKYVREEHLLTLPDAIRKMTFEPAERARLSNKGRLSVGADADITVFDPDHIEDKATFENPGQASEGVRYLAVNGVLIIKDGHLDTTVFPGQGIMRAK